MHAPTLHALTRSMAAWTRGEDALLGAMPDVALDGDAVAILAPGGRAGGVARAAHTPTSDPRSLWVASSADLLQLRLALDASADDVRKVLDAWLDRKPTPVVESGGEHAWSLRIPVVARQAVVPLLERGFAPSTSTMVRPIAERDATSPMPPRGATVRGAASDDRPALVALMRELLATEVAFGATRSREVGLGDRHVDDALGHGEGWSLVAEVDGDVVGWMSLSPFEHSGWAAPSTSSEHVAYLGIASIARAHRSRGLGRALADRLHAHAAGHGATATLLDASAANPWSVPFWHRMGYRPLWTTWQRRVERA